MFFRFEGASDANPTTQLDPFVPVLMLVAVAHSRPLHLRGTVSPALLEHTSVAMRIWQSWKSSYRPVRIDATAVNIEAHRAPRAASFFSGGVDSFYTLLNLASRYHAADPRAIEYLIICHGFEIPLTDPERFQRARRSAANVAAACGRRLVSCTTNAREFMKDIDWLLFAFGPLLAGVGLALRSVVGCVYIPSGWAYDEMQPIAAHPMVDPLWSTEVVDIVHSGAEATRDRKVAKIAQSEIVREHLRVCWLNTSEDQNCCRCEKCLRTMVEFALLGMLEGSAAFPQPLTPAAISNLAIDAHLFPFWASWLTRARNSEVDPRIVQAVEEVLARERFDHSARGKFLGRFVVEPLAKAGITPDLLKRLDAAVFGGRLVRGVRAARRRVSKP
jgi:hypothetical protein